MAAKHFGIKILCPQAKAQGLPGTLGISAAPKKCQPTAGQNLTRGEQEHQHSDPEEREHEVNGIRGWGFEIEEMHSIRNLAEKAQICRRN